MLLTFGGSKPIPVSLYDSAHTASRPLDVSVDTTADGGLLGVREILKQATITPELVTVLRGSGSLGAVWVIRVANPVNLLLALDEDTCDALYRSLPVDHVLRKQNCMRQATNGIFFRWQPRTKCAIRPELKHKLARSSPASSETSETISEPRSEPLSPSLRERAVGTTTGTTAVTALVVAPPPRGAELAVSPVRKRKHDDSKSEPDDSSSDESELSDGGSSSSESGDSGDSSDGSVHAFSAAEADESEPSERVVAVVAPTRRMPAAGRAAGRASGRGRGRGGGAGRPRRAVAARPPPPIALLAAPPAPVVAAAAAPPAPPVAPPPAAPIAQDALRVLLAPVVESLANAIIGALQHQPQSHGAAAPPR